MTRTVISVETGFAAKPTFTTNLRPQSDPASPLLGLTPSQLGTDMKYNSLDALLLAILLYIIFHQTELIALLDAWVQYLTWIAEAGLP